jgi:hypothetical protein
MIPSPITSSQDYGKRSRKGKEAANSANGRLHCLHVVPNTGKVIITFMIFMTFYEISD